MTGVADGCSVLVELVVVLPWDDKPSEPLRFFCATSILSSHSRRTTCLFARSSPNSVSVLHPLVAIRCSVAANALSSNSICCNRSSTLFSSEMEGNWRCVSCGECCGGLTLRREDMLRIGADGGGMAGERISVGR